MPGRELRLYFITLLYQSDRCRQDGVWMQALTDSPRLLRRTLLDQGLQFGGIYPAVLVGVGILGIADGGLR